VYNDYYSDFYRQVNQALAQQVLRAVNGEFNAIHCYTRLEKLVSRPKEKEVVREILSDEKKHLDEFSRLYISLTGKQPTVAKSNECPHAKEDIFEFSFNDEQETTDFYLEIADQTTDPTIKSMFTRASADEQNHAVWFLYFITKNRI
jgi:rubrerythrin